jgi:hypothetical protein
MFGSSCITTFFTPWTKNRTNLSVKEKLELIEEQNFEYPLHVFVLNMAIWTFGCNIHSPILDTPFPQLVS